MFEAASTSTCQTGPDCTAERCRWRCAVDVIDELLRQPGAVTGEEMDQLLEFRWQLGQATAAEATLRLFSALRIGMERRHYLAFFRIRRWLENHIVSVCRTADGAHEQRVPVRLDHYCVEAVRRVSLCAGLSRPDRVAGTRIEFEFQNWPVVAAAPRASALALVG